MLYFIFFGGFMSGVLMTFGAYWGYQAYKLGELRKLLRMLEDAQKELDDSV